MSDKRFRETDSGLRLPDWKRVRVPADVERLATTVVDSAFAVHQELGPGLLESAYEACLSRELHLRGINHQLQLPVPLNYIGIRVEVGYRADVIVEEKLLIELKAIDELLPIHTAQVITYLPQEIPVGFADQLQRDFD